MTAREAIQKEIDREQKEFNDLNKEADRVMQAAIGAQGAQYKALLEQAKQLIRELIIRKPEIEGKKKALAAVDGNPSAPIDAIDGEIEKEQKQADKDGERAEQLREQAFQEDQQGKTGQAKAHREEANKLSKEFDDELGRLRGKREARRAVQHALASQNK